MANSLSVIRKAARILLTMDENDPRRLFEGKFLIRRKEFVLKSLPILIMIITFLIRIQVRLSSEEW